MHVQAEPAIGRAVGHLSRQGPVGRHGIALWGARRAHPAMVDQGADRTLGG